MRQCKNKRQNFLKTDAKLSLKRNLLIPLSYLNKSCPGLLKKNAIFNCLFQLLFYFFFFGSDRQNSSAENAESSPSCLETAPFLKNGWQILFIASQILTALTQVFQEICKKCTNFVIGSCTLHSFLHFCHCTKHNPIRQEIRIRFFYCFMTINCGKLYKYRHDLCCQINFKNEPKKAFFRSGWINSIKFLPIPTIYFLVLKFFNIIMVGGGIKRKTGIKWVNPLTTKVTHYIETSRLTWFANQLTSSYMKGNIGCQLVKVGINIYCRIRLYATYFFVLIKIESSYHKTRE